MHFLLGFGVFLAVVILLAIIGGVQSFRAHTRHYGTIPVLFRYFSGHHHHGREDRPYANMSPYRNKDLTLCRRRLHPRFRRAMHRIYAALFLPWLAFAYLHDTPLTWFFFAGVTFFLFVETLHHYQITHTLTVHHRTWVKPLHGALAPVIREPVPERSSEWLYVAPDRKKAAATLPKHYNPPETERNRIAQIMKEVLEMDENASVTWAVSGLSSHVTVVDRQPPPGHVTLADIQPAIDKISGQEKGHIERVVVGLGRGSDKGIESSETRHKHEVISVSLASDSPMIGLSIGPGGGKSQFARLVAAQVLHRGGVVLILDVKRISHAWARDLPNVRYAKTIKEIHEALLWLSREINRRTELADIATDVEGEVLANVGPRLLVIYEEANETRVRAQRHWQDIRNPKKDPQKSPALMAFEEACFMGRQLFANVLAAAQMMTALAAGSGAAREAMGIRILGRFSKNNWKMLCPEFDMPNRSMHPGRVQIVTDHVRECQIAFLSGAEAKHYASSGIVTPFPSEEWIDSGPPMITDGKSDPPVAPASEKMEIIDADIVEDTDVATLAEIRSLIPGKTLNAMRNDRARDPDFPEPEPEKRDGKTHLYNTLKVVNYYKRRNGHEVTG